MDHETHFSPKHLFTGVIVPAWLISLVTSGLVFSVNTIHMSAFQYAVVVLFIVLFYMTLALSIYCVLVTIIWFTGRLLTSQSGIKWLSGVVISGGVAGSFSLLYLSDLFRHYFFVTRVIPVKIGWMLLSLLSIVLLSWSITFLYYLLNRLLAKHVRAVVVMVILISLIWPGILHRFILEDTFQRQKEKLGQRGRPELSSYDKSVQPTAERVLMFGIDGATWRMLIPLLKTGYCPVIKRLYSQGVAAPLETIFPTLSPVIWTSIATGMLPEKHGIQHFARFRIPILGVIPAKLRWPEHTFLKQAVRGLESVGLVASELYTSQMRQQPTFYEILSSWNEKVGIVNWWCSWPVSPLNGFIVSERFSYSIGETILGSEEMRAKEIYPDVLDVYYRDKVRKPEELELDDVAPFMNVNGDDLQSFFQDGKKPWFFSNWFWFRTVHQSDRSMADIAMSLYKRYDPRLFCLYLQSVDVVEHHYWHYLEPDKFPSLSAEEVDKFQKVIPATYDFVDSIIASFLKEGTYGNVILVSDHGMVSTGRLPKSGDHVQGKPEGIFLAQGPAIKKKNSAPHMSVIDVAPLLLTIMGYPVSDDMDGRIPLDLITPAFLAEHKPTRVENYHSMHLVEGPTSTSPTDTELFNKLKGLGYMN